MIIMALSYTQKTHDMSLIKTYVSRFPHTSSLPSTYLTAPSSSSACLTSGRSS